MEENITHEENATSNQEQELTQEDLVQEHDDVLDALVELLIQKGIISEQELHDKIESLYEENNNEEEEEEDENFSDPDTEPEGDAGAINDE